METCRLCGELTDSVKLLCSTCEAGLRSTIPSEGEANCRMCGEPTDRETLLCFTCEANLRASEPMPQNEVGFIDEETGLMLLPLDAHSLGRSGQLDTIRRESRFRCQTCGRMSNCLCGPGCPHCDATGTPKGNRGRRSQCEQS
jgi:hypothetical protein